MTVDYMARRVTMFARKSVLASIFLVEEKGICVWVVRVKKSVLLPSAVELEKNSMDNSSLPVQDSCSEKHNVPLCIHARATSSLGAILDFRGIA